MGLDFLEIQILSNKLVDYSIALLILISSILIIKILRSLAIRSLKKWAAKTTNPFDNGDKERAIDLEIGNRGKIHYLR